MSDNLDFEQLKKKYLSEMNGMIAKKNQEKQNENTSIAEFAANSAIQNAAVGDDSENSHAQQPAASADNARNNYENDNVFGNLKDNLPEFDGGNDNEKSNYENSERDNNYGDDGNEPNMAATAKGTLSVEVTSAGRAVPIEGAYIIISENVNGKSTLLYTLQSDRNGETRSVELPTYPKELSNDPDFFGKPYKTYTVTAKKNGFFTVEDLQVPIFADLNSIQPINMIPIPENYNGGQMIINEETQTLPIIKPNEPTSAEKIQ